LFERFDHRRDVVRVADIGSPGGYIPADLSRECFYLLAPCDSENTGAFGRESGGNGAADPRAGPGDECDFALQSGHMAG
jgi:hypothetical protein